MAGKASLPMRSPDAQFRRQVCDMIFRASGMDPAEAEKMLETPPQGVGADLAFPCFALARGQGKHPAQIAKELSIRLKPEGLVKDVRVKEAYINFCADWDQLAPAVVADVLARGPRYGAGDLKQKRVLVEHTSANPDGPLHLGHLRNTVIGDSLARIYAFCGFPTKTDFYFNTTGRQIAIAALAYNRLNGRLPEGAKIPYQGKPDWDVFEFYRRGNIDLEKDKAMEQEIANLILRFESGNQKVRDMYSSVVSKALEGHRQTLARLGVSIDNFADEADYIFSGRVGKILGEIQRRIDIGRTDGKRLWVDLSRFGIDREFTLTRSDGTTIYPARDLAYHEDKFSRADINVNVIGTDQKFYFRQLTSALSLLYPEKTRDYTVVFYEFLVLPEGSMSTRLGKFVSVDELLDRSMALAMKVVEEKMPDYSTEEKEAVARAVSVGAMKYAMVKVSPEKTYAFSVEDALSFEGDNAPYIQYTHARAASILRKAQTAEAAPGAGAYKEEKELALVKALIEFPRVVAEAARDFRPHYVANYAYRLASQFNDFYQAVPVLKAPVECVQPRLALVKAASVVISNALSLLGIGSPERM